MPSNKIRRTIFILIISQMYLFGQDVAKVGEPEVSKWKWVLDNLLFIGGGIIIFAAFYVLLKLGFSLLALQKATLMKELGVEKEEVLREIQQPFWKKAYDWLWSIVPVGRETEVDLGHDYDGIRELDNRLPPWWLLLFYGSIVFAAGYMWYYHWSGREWSSQQEYTESIQKTKVEIRANLTQMAESVDENSVELVTDEESLSIGKEIFTTNCAVCHGQEGQGLVGPNFVDANWIHGGGVKDLFTIIKYGVPEKGMISWRTQLRPTQIQNVASYILSMQGTNPPNQKAAEGPLWVPPTEEAKATMTTETIDTTKK